ncbi:hypothetical protein [Geminicoccus flavidas]|uniref:hypothetical protein n=1 Tax=Geminicoccus flavidas TaxID=2506407 RepID=UPI0013572366|nr:hypothetical protein [Geminicoccus flavidas]
MITAIVRYRLPATIGKEACRAHFAKIAAGFGEARGLIRKQFIWSERGVAGGVYQWETLEDARRFYQGPWLDGILARYGSYPDIEYFTTFAVTDNPGGIVTLPPAGDQPQSQPERGEIR